MGTGLPDAIAPFAVVQSGPPDLNGVNRISASSRQDHGASGTLTPMLAQYFDIKKEHPDALLFYRMGDFYEMFFTDAVEAAGALDITLTRRGRHHGEDIPMCGVPVHSADAYLSRLIRKGFRVAICDQVEAPEEARRRGSKQLVRRAVSRVITPGTLTEDTLLEPGRNNFLAGLAELRGTCGVAWVDISTGTFLVQETDRDGLALLLARIAPSELLVPDRLDANALDDWRDILVPQPSARFDSINGERRLKALFGVDALDGFGSFSRVELAAAGALVDYLDLTQQGRLPRLRPPARCDGADTVVIDTATRTNLELLRTLAGDRRGSLLGVIDRTATSAGARLLADRLAAPLTDPAAIDARLDEVSHFAARPELRGDVRNRLATMTDLERAVSRLSLERGGPRDLAAVRDGLDCAGGLAALLADAPGGIGAIAAALDGHGDLVALLEAALVERPGLAARDGGFIAAGHDGDLDRLRSLRDDSRRMIAALQQRYAEETGVASLKVRHNNVLGYFVEVTAVQAGKVQAHQDFIHRQTMANTMRFTTAELGELERDLGQAADRALALELELFRFLVEQVCARAGAIDRAAAALARLDVASSLADLGVDRSWVRPRIDHSLDFTVSEGRHPVVEALAAEGEPFVANGCDLARDQRLWLVTGPNMAGKSTFLRQNALIAVLAQTGSYVPARDAHIGVIDRLFSRVGAADDLARGRSTFMVEMVETAAILNQATERSLVILDEIGRGTATWDGLSIAWAVLEHLHEVNASRTLFATHFHELTVLADTLPALACCTMRIREWNDDIVFLHEVVRGTADRSYGIHVARRAGLPGAVIERARDVLDRLESDERSGTARRLIEELPLFRSVPLPPPPEHGEPDPLAGRLRELDPDRLTPFAALEMLYELKELASDRDGDR